MAIRSLEMETGGAGPGSTEEPERVKILLVDDQPDNLLSAEAVLESRSDLRRLDQLIEALPVPLRETIVLRELHELGYREIAEVTGVPIGTVMSRLHRARSLLLGAWNTKETGDARIGQRRRPSPFPAAGGRRSPSR